MNKIALVTGASRGLGRNTALSIARHGGDVILTYQQPGARTRRPSSREIEALGRKAVALQLDTGECRGFRRLRRAACSAALRETWQRDTFDHLVNNAGHGDHAPDRRDHRGAVRRAGRTCTSRACSSSPRRCCR